MSLRTTFLQIIGISAIAMLSLSINVYAAPPSTPQAPTTASHPLIKAGTVAFARLTTPVSSDNSENLVTATIIDGKYKGAKLIGKLISKHSAEDGKKTILHFTSIHFDKKDMPTEQISAYAIDFDEARIAMVTEQDYDDLKPNGINMASTFLETYTNKSKIKMGAGNDLGILFMSNVG